MKTLNLYAGVGGNRKLWDRVQVTAIEIDKQIAQIYQSHFPNDNVIVGDAHQYLLDHYQEFEFIWSSPPCTSHSIIRKNTSVNRGRCKPIYPDMRLYEEILFLKHYFNGKWVVENVKGYYAPLIKPQLLQRHYIWANFHIPQVIRKSDNLEFGTINKWEQQFDFNLWYANIDKRKLLRNIVDPKLGLHILKSARGEYNRLDHYIK